MEREERSLRQQTLADVSFEKSHKEPVLNSLEQVILWQELCGAIEPY
jgi:hypothetical protein